MRKAFLGVRLRRLREEKGLTQAALAKAGRELIRALHGFAIPSMQGQERARDDRHAGHQLA
ncbi:MAG: hypothetical protein J0I75_09390, partial [Hyphomicrobium sp.]|nr:hypothetical protein [Hyphomicrobium sp.]